MSILATAALFLLLQTPRAGIEGFVVRAGTNEPIAGARITVGGGAAPVQPVVSDSQGRFVIKDLEPADYEVFAWEDIEPFAYNDPEVLRRYEQLGVPVKVSESSKVTAEARIIPAGQ